MPTHTKPRDEQSPLDILTELAVEGTSSLVEAQRALLDLVQQENNIVLNGVKERVGAFSPAVAMTDLVKRSVDAVIEMQQELLTSTSKQTLTWLESEKAGKADRAAQLAEVAREGVETFARAQKKFLEAVAQQTSKTAQGNHPHDGKAGKKTEVAHLAREAGAAFIEAQKRLLDVAGQQMNVNLDATARTLELVSPSQLMPMASRTGKDVKSFVAAQTSLLGSLIKPPKKVAVRAKAKGRRKVRTQEAVSV